MDKVIITEVCPRDGLQNEAITIPTEMKVRLVCDLFEAGMKEVEVTSLVSPARVPQMADSTELLGQLMPLKPGMSVLVPNQKGLERALKFSPTKIAVLTAASDDFLKANLNTQLTESLSEISRLVSHYRSEIAGGYVRAYISTVVECPFAGLVAPSRVAEIAEKLLELGVDEVVMGETIGRAVPDECLAVQSVVSQVVDPSRVAWHLHDTNGTALASVMALLKEGIRRFDSSAGGLGGCPYAPGAGGNLATEDLVYALERSGYSTGVNLASLARVTLPVLDYLQRPISAKAQLATLAHS